MIVARAGGGTLRVVTQPDHAFFCGELLGLWRADGLPDHPRRGDLRFAAREHDNGWRELDASPRVDPASRAPADFLHLPAELRRDLWRRGTTRYPSRPYASALIARHALQLFRGVSRADEAERAFLAALDEHLARCLDEAGATTEELEADYPWLELVDRLSLLACGASPRPLEPPRAAEVRAHPETALAATLVIRPFPLAGPTTFRVPCRLVPDRPYTGDADFAGEAAAARWQDLVVRVK